MSYLPIPAKGKFYDLNLPCQSEKTFKNKIFRLVELGYEVVAITNYWKCEKITTNKGLKINVPDPPKKFDETEQMRNILRHRNQTLTQYTRLTIELQSLDDLVKVREAIGKGKYDILAVQPYTDKLFHTCCTELNIDIICINDESSLTYLPYVTAVRRALSRGIYFEICYSAIIRNPSSRLVAVVNVGKFAQFSKGKNLILSSGSLAESEIRSPFDVANLTSLFFAKPKYFMLSVSDNCRAVVVHAFSRKTAKGAIFLERLSHPVHHETTENLSETKTEHDIVAGLKKTYATKISDIVENSIISASTPEKNKRPLDYKETTEDCRKKAKTT